MAVSAVFPRVQYLSAASQTDFLVPFKFFINEDLVVYKTLVGQQPDPATDLLALNVDYTVVGAGLDTGGTVTLVIPAALDDIITIERDLVASRPPELDFKVDGTFTVAELNDNFDKTVMLEQQNETLIRERMLLYPATDQLTAGNLVLPKLEKNQIWKANNAGNLQNVDIEENPDTSTLRSELASETAIAPGTDLIGAYNVNLGGGQLLTTYLNTLYQELYVDFPAQIRAEIQGGALTYTASASAANTYVANTTPSFTPTNATHIFIAFTNTNTGAATLDLNGVGALPILTQAGNALLGGEIVNTGRYILQNVDGVSWRIMSFPTEASGERMKLADDANFMVTPSSMLYSPFVLSAVGVFSNTGTAVTYYSKNISSIVGGPGSVGVTLLHPMATENYGVLFTSGYETAGADLVVSVVASSRTTTSFELRFEDRTGGIAGGAKNTVAVVGPIATP